MGFTMQKERKYWVIVFVQNKETPIKWRVTQMSFKSMFYYLQNHYSQWLSINVYERGANSAKGGFVVQLTPNNFWNKIKML